MSTAEQPSTTPAHEPAPERPSAPPPVSATATSVTSGPAAAFAHPTRRYLVLAAAAAAFMALGSLGPWVTASTMIGQLSVNGTSGDGVLTLLLAVAALAVCTYVLLRDAGDRWAHWTVAVLGLLGALVTTSTLSKLGDIDTNGFATASAGWGVILTLLAGLVMLALGVVGGLAQRRATGTPATAPAVA